MSLLNAGKGVLCCGIDDVNTGTTTACDTNSTMIFIMKINRLPVQRLKYSRVLHTKQSSARTGGKVLKIACKKSWTHRGERWGLLEWRRSSIFSYALLGSNSVLVGKIELLLALRLSLGNLRRKLIFVNFTPIYYNWKTTMEYLIIW